MASPTESPLGASLDFLRVLWRVNHGLERRSRYMLSSLGVTAPQRMLLRLVGRFQGATPKELAELLWIDPGTLSTTLGRLERDGMLTRTPCKDDARRTRVRLTPKGARLDRETPGTVESAVAALIAEVPPARVAQAAQLLTALAEILESPPEPETTAVMGRVKKSVARSTPRKGEA